MSSNYGTLATNPSQQVFTSFKNHNLKPRSSTELTILEAIRAFHPAQHVTTTSPANVDLRGYASAGHAQLTANGTNLYDATRGYVAPSNRLSDLPGRLKDNIRFATFNYVFNGHSFVVYEVQYEQAMFRPPVKLFFIVSPKIPESGATETDGTVVDDLLLTIGSWSSNLHKEIYVFDAGAWSKDRALYNSVQTSSFDSVILSPSLKKSLIADILTFFSSRSTYARLSVPWKRGLLFHGLPGNGKTISIRATINALSSLPSPIPSLVVKSFDALQGPKYSIREIFMKARSMAPCLLVFEDLDSLITDKTRSYFLNEVDGLECNDGILMIGTANNIENLDAAISKRPSRFDRKYHFRLPNEEERVLYCEFWRRKLDANDDKEGSEGVKFTEQISGIVAKLTDSFSFAYMKELFVISLLTIARGENVGDQSEVATDLQDASEESTTFTTPSTVDTDPVPIEQRAELASTAPAASVPALPACGCTCSHKFPAQPAEPKGLVALNTEKPQIPKKKRVLPSIAIPPHLQDNLLLKVLHAQCKSLLKEMDDTDEDQWIGSSSKANKKSDGSDRSGIPRNLLAVMGEDCC